MERASAASTEIKLEIAGVTDTAGNLRKYLEGWCVYWALKGGCTNFSLSFYEKKFRVEHFYNSSDPAGGVTRLRKAASLKGQLTMWNYMMADLEQIINCHEYLKRNNPERLEELQELETSFMAKKNGDKISLISRIFKMAVSNRLIL